MGKEGWRDSSKNLQKGGERWRRGVEAKRGEVRLK